MPDNKITVGEFESKVLGLEEIKIIVRAPWGDQVSDYSYERKAASTTTMSEWIEQRIRPCLGNREFVIVSGDYSHPHGKTKLETIRNSYER